jgi:hypothetical protein
MQPQIEKAIKDAVKEHGQNDDVAKKIIAWLKELSVGNELIDDTHSAHQRVSVLYEATIIKQ